VGETCIRARSGYTGGEMRIEFSLTSVLSTIILLYVCTLGGSPSIDSLSIGADIVGDELRIGIHPIIRVDIDNNAISDVVENALGLAFGNIIIIDSDIPYECKLNLVLEHERNHSKQWKGMGIIKLLANRFLNMEGQDENPYTNWWRSTEYRNRTMWVPPSWWPYQWSFLTVTLPLGMQHSE